jgi:hypothetical protein
MRTFAPVESINTMSGVVVLKGNLCENGLY